MPQAALPRRVTKALNSLGDIDDPLARLAAVRSARQALEALEHETVTQARAGGATWGQIGTLYGVSKQAAQQRFRQPADPLPGGPPSGDRSARGR
ncbi:MAG: hypothetical protein WCF36_17975 [Candidatus Nanopelagicales bacterium]